MTRLWAAGEPVQVVVSGQDAHPPDAAQLKEEGKRKKEDRTFLSGTTSSFREAPVRFQLRGEWHEVAFIANRWRVHTTWWRPEASAQREYFKLATSGGLLCVLYHDLQDQAWYCARVYD